MVTRPSHQKNRLAFLIGRAEVAVNPFFMKRMPEATDASPVPPMTPMKGIWEDLIRRRIAARSSNGAGRWVVKLLLRDEARRSYARNPRPAVREQWRRSRLLPTPKTARRARSTKALWRGQKHQSARVDDDSSAQSPLSSPVAGGLKNGVFSSVEEPVMKQVTPTAAVSDGVTL